MCDSFSVRLDSGICFRCVPGSFKKDNLCTPCILNCLQCLNAQSCIQCGVGFVLNPITSTCDNSSVSTETPEGSCKKEENQTLNVELNICECSPSFENISNVCQCPSDFIIDTESGICILGTTHTRSLDFCGVEEVFDGEKCIFCNNGTYPNPA